jgi:transcriptional regulator with XRE-family HTH domain
VGLLASWGGSAAKWTALTAERGHGLRRRGPKGPGWRGPSTPAVWTLGRTGRALVNGRRPSRGPGPLNGRLSDGSGQASVVHRHNDGLEGAKISGDEVRIAARRRLGAELRAMREALGLTGQQVADRLTWSQAKVSRIEMAKTRAEVTDVSDLLAALEVSDKLSLELVSLAELAAGPRDAWRNSSRVGLTRRQQDFIDAEGAAVLIRHYQPVLLPGYLQTPAYARSVIEMAGSLDVERALEHRQARRQVMTKPGGPLYEIVVMEAVLRWRPGEPAEMAEQLRLLVDIAGRRNVTLRVVTYDNAQPVYVQHPFVVYDFEDKAPAEVLVETSTRDLHLRDLADVTVYTGWFELLSRSALSAKDSVRLISGLAREMDSWSGS